MDIAIKLALSFIVFILVAVVLGNILSFGQDQALGFAESVISP